MPHGALSSVRVVDLTYYIAGPYCTKLLADYGARVIKIEPPGRGDEARYEGPFPRDIPDPEKSGLFLFLNPNKRSVTLNLETEEGRGLVLRLIADADVLVENDPPGYLAGLGLGYEDLAPINPKLVYTSITTFGQSGPYRDYVGPEIVAEAMGGLMYVTGDRDRPPLKYGLTQAHFMAGTAAAAGTLTALYCQRETGEGQHVDVSTVEALSSAYFGHYAAYSYGGVVNVRGANDMYPVKDGYLVPSQGGTNPWERYAALLDAPELTDPKFATLEGRVIHETELQSILERKLRERTKREWLMTAQANRFPFGYLQEPQELLDCPQLAARDFWQELNHAAVGTIPFPGAPFKMTESPWALRQAAPLLGAHTEEVLSDQLGLSKAEVTRLRARGIL